MAGGRTTRDDEAFLEAYSEYVWDVYGFLAYRLDSEAEAEDLTQTTFERALRGWHYFDSGKASLRTWLISIARNALIDRHRRSREVVAEPGFFEEAELVSDFESDRNLGPRPELAAAIGRLSDREREVIALRFGADLPGAEVAKVLGTTEGNVHQALARALRKMRVELAGDPHAQPPATGGEPQ